MAAIEFLPDEILEDVLLRLPYVSVMFAKDVCRKWRQVLESKSFTQSYRSTAKVTVEVCRRREIVDSNSNALHWEGRSNFGSVTSRINGLVMYDGISGYYVGNIFSNEWDEIPTPPDGYLEVSETAIFYSRAGHHKLVYWRIGVLSSEIMTLEAGQDEWCIVHSNSELEFCSNPVVIKNSVFRVFDDGLLSEYESVTGQLSSTHIVLSDSEEILHFDGPELMVWQDKLHVLRVLRNGDGCMLEIWQLSPGNGRWRATFVSRFELERRVDHFEIMEEEDDGLLHLQGYLDNGLTVVSVVYDMAAKSVKGVNTGYKSKVVQMPVKFNNAFQNAFQLK